MPDYSEKHIVDVVTASGGGATSFSPVITGKIINLIYIKDGTAPFTDGVDFTITVESTGQGIWTESDVNASKTVAPRQPIHDPAGAQSLYAAAGEPIGDHIYVAKDRVKIVVAAGGDTKSGRFIAIVG